MCFAMERVYMGPKERERFKEIVEAHFKPQWPDEDWNVFPKTLIEDKGSADGN